MAITWLTPIAFAGLALIAAPILIHLLTRQQRREIPFPSLRFLTPTRLSALSRRRIDDWPLLLLRVAVVGAAVTALAAPLFVTSAREREWASRVSRALIVFGNVSVLDEERRTAFESATFDAQDRIADAVASALSWLDGRPPSSREVVVAGDLRVGMLREHDIARIPADIGLRFLPDTNLEVVRNVAVPVLRNVAGSAAPAVVPLRLDDDSTVMNKAEPPGTAEGGSDALDVLAPPADRAVAEAALRAVLSGLVVRDQAARRHVVVAWPGADVSALGPAVTPPTLDWVTGAVERLGRPARQHGEVLLVQLETRPLGARAAVEIAGIARAVFTDPRTAFEPRRLSAAELARWSRPPGGPGADQPRRDEGDRRWLWGVVLALLVVEQIVRRQRSSSSRATEMRQQETHVA